MEIVKVKEHSKSSNPANSLKFLKFSDVIYFYHEKSKFLSWQEMFHHSDN